ncbi:MAG: ImmA/IrrE family metallo-endopeptidase [Desulfobacteraceae bacterium]|jgi:HTH-type transcriptional regulator/antitoxin HigA|nr:ImmA/IrrE family metallo-endopeptidase [Desulfobacteraceae bacterium]
MNIRPVNSEQAYDEAIKRIETLWGAESGTLEGDELDVLLTLVRVYEKENHPVPPPTPIEAIRFVMDQRGMKQVDLVPYIGSRSKVSEILRGKRTLSLSMIRSLHTHLNIPAEVLISNEMNFPLNGEDVNWDSFPVKEIVDRGWITGFDYKTQAEEIMRELASQACADFYFTDQNRVCLRQGDGRKKKDNSYSIDAWILRVLAQAEEIETGLKFNPDIIDNSFIKKLAYLSVLKDGPLRARELLQNKGIKLVVVPHFDRTYLDGAALINKKGEPIIALSLRYDRLDNFWFTLSHELAHLMLGHVYSADGQCIIDDLDLIDLQDEIENEANELATESLIPSQLWNSHPARKTRKIKDILDLAAKADIHKSIVAGRIRYERKNHSILWPHVGKGIVRKLFLT